MADLHKIPNGVLMGLLDDSNTGAVPSLSNNELCEGAELSGISIRH